MQPPPLRSVGPLLIVLACLPFLYVGMYFAILALPASMRLPASMASNSSTAKVRFLATPHSWQSFPDYRGLPEWLFSPAHELDRSYLRPGQWSGTVDREQELSLDWLK